MFTKSPEVLFLTPCLSSVFLWLESEWEKGPIPAQLTLSLSLSPSPSLCLLFPGHQGDFQ